MSLVEHYSLGWPDPTIPRLHPLQLFLPDYVCFSCYSPIASACDHKQVIQSIVCTKAILMMNYLDSEWLKVAPDLLGGMSPDPLV